MAISPVAGMVYANQGMQAPATTQAEFQNRLDAQTAAAMVASQEEKAKVEEIRPTEESYLIDPENEHEKDKADQEQEEQSEEETEEEEEEKKEVKQLAPDEIEEDFLLDIKI